MIKKFNICTARTYIRNGEEKKAWLRVGTLTYFPASDRYEEGYKLEMNMWPTTQFFIFEDKPEAPESRRTDAEPAHDMDAETGAIRPASKEIDRKRTPKVGGGDGIEYPTEEINPDDIPF